MQFYTEHDCEEWLEARNLILRSQDRHTAEFFVRCDEKTARYRTISDWVARHLASDRQTLLWITEWSIWPSSEDWPLYDRMRQFHGGTRKLYQAPGHLFNHAELDDFELFLRVALESGWGGWVLPQAEVSMWFSHDSYFIFYAKRESALQQVKDFFATDPCSGR